jgi:hypothetical protein
MSAWRWWSGVFGLAFVVLQVVGVGLFVAAGVPPGPEDAVKLTAYVTKNSSSFLWVAIVSFLSIAAAYVWLLGIRGILREAGEEHEWAGVFTFGVGLVSGALALVGFGLIAGAALDAGSPKPEPIAVRTMFEASTGIFGPLGGVITGLFIAAAAYGTFASGALPRWTGWVGYVAAVLNIVSIFSLLGGTDPKQFFSATGFAPLVMGLLPLLVYATVTSIAMMRSKVKA